MEKIEVEEEEKDKNKHQEIEEDSLDKKEIKEDEEERLTADNDESIEHNIEENKDKLANLQEDINLPKEESLVKETKSLNQLSFEFFKLEPILYGYPIKPVAAKAQKKVPIPTELDLELPFREQYSSDEEIKLDFNSDDGEDLFMNKNDSDDDQTDKKKKKRKKHKKDKKSGRKISKVENEEEKQPREDNLMYLKSKSKLKKNDSPDKGETIEAVEAIEGNFVETNRTSIPGLVSSDKYFQESKKLKSSDKKSKKSKSLIYLKKKF